MYFLQIDHFQGQARGIWTYHSLKFEIWLYHEGPTLQSIITQKWLELSLSFFHIPIQQCLKSAPQENLSYVAMLRYVSCFPSCQERFFNVDKQLFGDQFRSTWELD